MKACATSMAMQQKSGSKAQLAPPKMGRKGRGKGSFKRVSK